MKKLEKQKSIIYSEYLKLSAKYLEINGWRAIVMGPPRIQQPFGSAKMNFEFVIPFTGGKVRKKRAKK